MGQPIHRNAVCRSDAWFSNRPAVYRARGGSGIESEQTLTMCNSSAGVGGVGWVHGGTEDLVHLGSNESVEYNSPRSDSLYVQVHVQDPDGTEFWFKLKRRCPLGLLFEVYCSRMQLLAQDVDFILHGNKIYADQTPEQLEMDEYDSIAVQHNHR
mmetsp:Transcript_12522/g.27312  ORF Transcript_12522/g.27312 Transcript_12522/m.27312 type:complete len:155 (+) Transcript_12522:180-644(+)